MKARQRLPTRNSDCKCFLLSCCGKQWPNYLEANHTHGRPSAAHLNATWSMAAFGRPPVRCPPEQSNEKKRNRFYFVIHKLKYLDLPKADPMHSQWLKWVNKWQQSIWNACWNGFRNNDKLCTLTLRRQLASEIMTSTISALFLTFSKEAKQ